MIPNIEFPDIQTYMEQMQPEHSEAPCHAAFKLYEYLFADSDAGDNATLNKLAEIWETSPKEIAQHMSCVHAFLEKEYPDVLRAMPTGSKKETADTDEDDEHDDDDYFDREQYSKYNGYNDWPDQAIDEAFEGDPEATWNVD